MSHGVGSSNCLPKTAWPPLTENGAKTLESTEFNPSATILPITVRNNSDSLLFDEVTATQISITTIQKLFNIDADSYKNVTADWAIGGDAGGNLMILTAKDGFVFEDGTDNGAKTLASANFNVIA